MSSTLEATPPRAEHARASSLPARLLELADERPKVVALRVKELGRWREISWADYAAQVETVGRGLIALGVKAGDRVGVAVDNRPEWLVSDLAIQGIGAATVGAFLTGSADELGSLFKRAGVKVAIAEDEEQLDKLLQVRSQTSIERVVVIDTRGIRQLDDPAMSFEALEALGSPEALSARGGDLSEWRERVSELSVDGVATVAFTPGTTGDPKGVLLTHGNLVAAAGAGVEALGLDRDDEIVSSLPLAEISERMMCSAYAPSAGCTVNFGEGGGSLLNDLREAEPTVFLGVPRLWEYFQAQVETGLRNAGRIKTAAVRTATKRPSFLLEALVTRPLRRRLGFGRLRVALTATAPAPAELIEWWRRVGVQLREVYDVAEAAGAVTVTPADDIQPGAVGRALAGVEVRVEGEGAVQVRGATVFAGYVDHPEATTAALSGGWFNTGDVGSLEGGGVLRILGRSEDLITSAGGTVAPTALEQRLEASPFVRAAVVVGNGRPHPGALLVIDDGTVGDWAASNDVPYTTFQTLTERPEVRELLGTSVDEVNAALAEHERIGCFALLPADLTYESGALTAIFKLRREAAEQQYASVIDGMYQGGGGGR